MSSHDVRDILSLPQRSTHEPGPSRAPVRVPPILPGDARPKQRPEGMSRELYALLGPNAPSLVMGQADGPGSDGPTGARAFQPKFQRKAATAPARRWMWTPFRNPARLDTPAESASDGARSGLVLHHWRPLDPNAPQNEEEEAPLDAVWAPYNTASQVFHYTTDEYTQYLADDDWTREETDYLIEMCDTYDLRFIVIADRYEWPGRTRTIEDLKARYYTICRRLLRERISNEDIETRQAQLQTYAYDRQLETERKRAVQTLFSRTPEQLAEEEALYVESRRFEQNEAKFAKERDDLLRLLGGREGLPTCTAATVAAVGAGLLWPPGSAADDTIGDGAKKSKRRRSEPAAAGVKAKDPQQQLWDAQHFITRFSTTSPHVLRTPYPNLIGTPSVLPPVATPSSGSTKAEANAHHGAYLRSTRMLTFRPNQYARVMQALSELHPSIGARLVYPTATNVEKWEMLLGAVAGALDMKKQLDRAEAEYKVVQARLAAAQAGRAAEPTSSAEGAVAPAT